MTSRPSTCVKECAQPGRDFERRRPHGHGAGGPGRQPDRDHRRAQPRLSQERDLEKITMKTTHSLVTLILCLAPLALAQTPTPAPAPAAAAPAAAPAASPVPVT